MERGQTRIKRIDADMIKKISENPSNPRLLGVPFLSSQTDSVDPNLEKSGYFRL